MEPLEDLQWLEWRMIPQLAWRFRFGLRSSLALAVFKVSWLMPIEKGICKWAVTTGTKGFKCANQSDVMSHCEEGFKCMNAMNFTFKVQILANQGVPGFCMFNQAGYQTVQPGFFFFFTRPGLHCRIVKTCCCHRALRGWETAGWPLSHSCVTK